jgi:maltooligosyltrehalose trehalohydrolase
MPQTPMLFQGQEFAASSTFHFFADHNPELAKLVRVGRAKEVSQFPSVATPAVQACLLNPDDRRAFDRCKLRWQELDEPMHAQMYQFHKDVLRLRREDPTFRRVPTRGQVDGAVLGPDAFVLRYFGEGDEGDRLVIVNLGRDLDFSVAPEPLLAPPAGKGWSVIWSSEHPQYGGCGNAPPETEQEGWLLPGRCTLVLKPLPMEEARIESRIRKSEDDNSGAAENSDAA